MTTAHSAAQPGPDEHRSTGRELFVTGCSTCHGLDGRGTALGPSLKSSGAAAAYYYLATGRMPAANSTPPLPRKPPAYSPTEIARLVSYVASLGDGPPIPDVDPAEGDLARGGVLYRANCAACHNGAGIGGALNYGVAAPPLGAATPTVVASAMRIGPGQMPVFAPDLLDEEDLNDVVRYVLYLQSPPDPGGLPLGRAGPIPEGFVAWIVGMGLVGVAALWIGRRSHNR